MTRTLFAAEKGLRIYDENSSANYADILQGAGAPPGTTGDSDAAPIGSIWLDRTNGVIYTKKTDTSSASDWQSSGDVSIDELSWRNETVRAATNDSVAPGSGIDPTSWTDNQSGEDATNWNVGDHVIVDVDGTPVLLEMTAKVSGTSITLAAASQAIADNDTFVVQSYLPDSPASQEEQAIIHFPDASAAGIKISDFNWSLADGISTTSGWDPDTDGAGAPAAQETLETTTEKIEKGVRDLVTLSGVARNSTVLGAFTSPASLLFAATYTIKSAFQRIGDLLAQLRGVQVIGITTSTVVDSVPHASVKCVKWIVEAVEDATPANRKAGEVLALTDGTSVDETKYAILKLGANFNLSYSVAINGANLELSAASTTAGVTVTARRIEVVKNVL